MEPSPDRSVSRNIETATPGPLGRQRGFALLAATGAALVVSLVIAGWYHRELGELEKAKVDTTRDIIISTAEVLYSWRLGNNNTWPSSMSALSALAPDLSANARNGVGQPLTLAPPSPPNHPTEPIVIRTDMLDPGLAAEVRSEFPGQARAGTGSVVEIEIPIPGHEPGARVQELLVRDGTRDMAGDLDMGGNDINDVDRFGINDRLVIGGEVLDGDSARFLVRLAGLNCGPDQLLAISGGVPSCIAWSPTDTLPPPPLPPAVPGVSITAGSPVTEGGNAVFTLRATVPFSSAVTVGLSVSDDAAADFLAAGDEGGKTVTFPAGVPSITWSVPTVDDADDEPDGQVTVTVRSGNGYVPYAPDSASVDVSDDDGGGTPRKPVITITGGGAITEGGNAVFTLRADRASVFSYGIALFVSDDATSDFLAASREGNRTITLPAGDTTVRYSVPTVDDTNDEPDGRVTVRIMGGPTFTYTTGSPSSASVQVRDDDAGPPGLPVITIAGGSAVTEGGTAVFTITADRVSTSSMAISINVSDDASSDFLAPSAEGYHSVSLPAGSTMTTYSVRTRDDALDEADGRVTVRIAGTSVYTAGAPSSASVRVLDDDAAPPGLPVITIAGRAGSIAEGGSAVFTISADRAPRAAIRVGLDVSDDATSDFLAASSEGSGSITLPAGATTARYSVPTVDDATDEPDGRVTVRIVGAAGYTVGSPSSASVGIRDDDVPPLGAPEVTISGGPPVTEGGNAVFTLRASRGSAAAIGIGLTVSDDATSDFLAPGNEGRKTVTLPARHTSVRYSVPTVDDTDDEPDGQVGARIASAAEYTVGSRSSGSVTVRDDDSAVPGCANPRPADLHPDADWDCDTGEPKCGPVRVRNVLTVINDQTTGRSWYQLTDISAASDCPVVNLGIGGNRRWKTRCDPDARTGDWLRACGPWQSRIYRTSEGACGVEYCLATPLSFNLVRGRGHLASTAGSLECPDPGSTTFGGIDFTSYRCRYIQPGINNNWKPR